MNHQRPQRRGAGGAGGTAHAATRTKEALHGAGPQARAAVGQAQASPERVCPAALLHTALVDFRAQGWALHHGHFSLAAARTLSDIKAYCEATGSDSLSWQKVGVQINGERDAWRRPQAHVFSGFLTKVPRQFNRERSIFSTNDARTIGCQYGERKKVTSYTRITLRGLMELKIRAYIVKLIDRNIGKRLRHHVVLKEVLERTHLS